MCIRDRNIRRDIVGLQILECSARGVGLNDWMIGVFLLDDVVSSLKIGNRDAAPPSFIEIFPQAESGMVPESIDNVTEGGFSRSIARGEFGQLTKIDPAKHAMLI